MKRIDDHLTGHLWDPRGHLGAKRRKMIATGWAGVFRDKLLDRLPVKKIASRFSENHGRPSKELHMMTGAVVLQQVFDLSDEQTVERMAFDRLVLSKL